MEKTKIAIVGIHGSISEVYLNVLASKELREKCEIVCGVDPKKNAVPFSFPVYKTWEEFENKHKVDAIIILTPPDTHYEMCMRALHYGAAVCIEKPPTLSSRECEELIEFANQRNQVLFFAWHAQYAFGAKTLQTALTGKKIVSINIEYREDVRDFRSPGTTNFKPGALWDSGINALSVLTYILPHHSFTISTVKLRDPSDKGVDTQANVSFSWQEKNYGTGYGKFIQHWMDPDPIIRTIHIETLVPPNVRSFYLLDIHQGFLKKDDVVIEKLDDRKTIEYEYKAEITHFLKCVKKGTSHAPIEPVKLVETIHATNKK